MQENNDIKIEEEGEGLSDKLKKLKDKLKKCQTEKDEYLAGWQRAKADFINFRKEQEKQQKEIIKFSNTILIYELLLVLDSFDLALKNNEDKGLYLIKSQLDDILKKSELTVIKTIGEKFNPEFHEAIEEVESEKESGIIVEELQKGYLLHNKVLRASKVKISRQRRTS